MGNPDVQGLEEAPRRMASPTGIRCSQLELVDVPLPEVTRSWSWQPRLTLQEERNFRPGPQEESPRVEATDAAIVAKGPMSLHSSHSWRTCGVIVFCWQCGLYLTRKEDMGVPKTAKQGVSQPCPGAAHKPQGKLCRLRKGHHPQTGKYVGPVTKAALDGLTKDAKSAERKTENVHT